MIKSEKTPSYSLYRGIKVILNTLADRVFEICNMLVQDAYQLPWPVARTVVERIARFAGDLSRLFQEFPRRTTYRFSGAKWTIVCIGRGRDENIVAEIQHLFFADEDVTPQELGRVALWQLSAQCERWWTEGVDLVVGSSSRISPYWPQALLRFSMPGWIRQAIELPDDLDTLLSGGRMKVVRQSINHAQKANFSWYYTQSKDDFNHFYHNMYVPYIKGRHGPRAFIASYEDVLQDFMLGGLIVITQNNTRVGGGVIYIRNKTCFTIKCGVLDNNPDFLKQGIIISLHWFTMNWAHQQGVRVYDIGGTRPWLSNGVFLYKSRWQAGVTRLRNIYKVWTFLARDISPELQQYINQIGFISEVKGKFYSTLLDTEQLPFSSFEIDKQLSMTQKEGLDGLLIVSANRRRVIPVVNPKAN